MAASSTMDSALVEKILEKLEEIGCTGPLLEELEGGVSGLEVAVKVGLADKNYVYLVMCLTSELKQLLSLNETVTEPAGPDDAESFHLELRSFLNELKCYHESLVTDLAALNEPGNRLILIDYLLSELMTARLLKIKIEDSTEYKRHNFDSNPYDVQSNLSAILKTYNVATPPPHVTPTMILDKIITKTKECVSKAPPGYIESPLVLQPLSPEQWGTLDRINEALLKEYSVRRQMLLTRCSVTVQSFKWSDRTKDKDEVFASVYQSKWSALKEKVPIPIARVLAAKKDLLSIERTSSGSVRENTVSDINKVMIGHVPDRGGRPNETRPPPEMPSFQQRTEAPREKREGGGRGGRGRGGGARGGRVQGGWSKGGGDSYQRSYSVDDHRVNQGGYWGGGGGGGGGYDGSFGGFQGGQYDPNYAAGGYDDYSGTYGSYGGNGGDYYGSGGRYGGGGGGGYGGGGGGYGGGGGGGQYYQRGNSYNERGSQRGGGGGGQGRRGGRGFQHQYSNYY